MNTQRNIKSFVTLLISVFAVLVLGGLSVQAQTATTDTTTTPAGTVDSSITIAVKGSVSDPNGTISVNGNVIISCRRVIDTTSQTTPALVLLDFDFSGVKGTSGSTKATLKTYITGENHATEIRPLQASDTVIIPVPYYDSSKDPLTARTMLVSVTLNYDVASGKVTGGSATVGNNVVTANSVGTIQTAPIQ